MKKVAMQRSEDRTRHVVDGDYKQVQESSGGRAAPINRNANRKVIDRADDRRAIAAAAEFVEDNGLVGKVLVTGRGWPLEMIRHVKSGAGVGVRAGVESTAR